MPNPWERDWSQPASQGGAPWERNWNQPSPEVAAGREANRGFGGYMGGLRRQVEQGLMFGLGDEYRAAIAATVGGPLGEGGTWRERYDRALSSERGRNTAFSQDNPVAATTSNIIGGVVAPSPLALAPAAPGAGAVSSALRSAPVRGAVAGGSGGALSGFGDATGGLDNRLDAALTGGALGGAGGAVLGAGLSLGGRMAGRVLDAVGMRNPETAAERHILRAMERDAAGGGRSMTEIQQALQNGTEPTILADVAGRNVTNLSALAANTPGASMEAADRVIQTRRGTAPERIATAVDSGLGGGAGTRVADEVAALQQSRTANAAPLYESAFSRIAPTADEAARVERFVADPIGQNALQRGLRVIELEHLARGERFDPATYGVTRGQDGNFALADGFRNLRLMDAVKRGFDDIVEGFRDPTSGRLNLDQYGRAVNDARASYVGELRNMYPRYGNALDAWGGPSQSLDALNRGQRSLTMNRDVVEQVANRLSPSDLDFFRLGMGRAITDATSDPSRAANFARRLVEDRQMQARLQSAIPDQAQREAFIAAMQREVDMAAVNRAVSPRAGSQTARLTAGGDDLMHDPPGGFLMTLLDTAARGGATAAASRAALSGYRRLEGMNPATASALANRLFETDASRNAEMLSQLFRRQTQDLTNQGMRQQLMARLLQGGGTAAGIAVAQ